MANFYEDSEEVKKKFKDSENEAEEMLKDSKKTQATLDNAMEKLKKASGPIEKFFEDIQLFIGVTRDWVTGKYREIPFASIASILGAIIYFVSPIDVIPDFIPGIGYLDDAFVIGLVLKQVDADLQKYKEWKLAH